MKVGPIFAGDGVPVQPDTVARLADEVGRAGGVRALAREWGLSPATISGLLRGDRRAVGLERENEVRARLGLAPVMRPVAVPPCPDCGGVHLAGRCHGRPVTVRLVRPPAPGKWASVSRVPKELSERRRALGSPPWRVVVALGLAVWEIIITKGDDVERILDAYNRAVDRTGDPTAAAILVLADALDRHAGTILRMAEGTDGQMGVLEALAGRGLAHPVGECLARPNEKEV